MGPIVSIDHMAMRTLALIPILGALLAMGVSPVGAASGMTRASVSSSGQQGNADSYRAALSGDGRYVAYVSESSNLVPGDFNLVNDVFLYDTQTNTTEMISLSTAGTQGNGHSGMDPYTIGSYPAISYDGRYVAFFSEADNLVPGDTNGEADIFMRDRLSGTTTRISLATNGAQGNGMCLHPWMSYDGRYVVFSSDADNLIPNDTNNATDVFVRDMVTGVTECVTYNNLGVLADSYSLEPTISGDGRFVTYHSDAHNLVPGVVDGWWDIYVYDRYTDTIECLTLDPVTGQEGNCYSATPRISADGRYVAFNSGATNLGPPDLNGFLSDIYVFDRQTHVMKMADVNAFGIQANNDCFWSGISGDGRKVSYCTFSDNLTPFDTNPYVDMYQVDMITRVTRVVSVSPSGFAGNYHGDCPVMGPDGNCVAFHSQATDMVPNDWNNRNDVFSTCGVDFDGPQPVPTLPSDFWVSRNSWRPDHDVPVEIRIHCRTPGRLSLKIYNTAGELVKVLWQGIFTNPDFFETITWDGKNENKEKVASGLYVVHYEDSTTTKTRLVGVLY